MYQEMQGVTMAFTSGGLAEGTNANTFKTAATITYAIDGRIFAKSATDNLPFSSAHTTLGNSQVCLFGVHLDTAGAVTTTQAKIVSSTELASGAAVLEWPSAQAGKVMVGAIRIETSASATFTANSTDFSASGITATLYNTSSSPTRPLTS